MAMNKKCENPECDHYVWHYSKAADMQLCRGCWYRAYRNGGDPKYKPRGVFSNETQRKRAIEMRYKRGMTLQAIANAFGCTKSAVSRFFDRVGNAG